MNIAFSEEQQQLREVVRKFLDECSSEEAVREQMVDERGYDPAVWTRMAEEIGLLGLTVPEIHGGAELGPVELVVVMEEMGRRLLCAPYFSTAVEATTALLESGDEAACAELLPKIAAGELVVALAVEEAGDGHDPSRAVARARPAGDEHALTGAKVPVIDGHVADVILVSAQTDSGLSLFRVDGEAAGLTRAALPPLDPTRKLSKLELDATPGALVGAEGGAEAVLKRVSDLACVALAAEQVGGAQVCLDMAVDYAKERLQFGRPIGSFQAIKHKCADVLLEVEGAKSAVYYAAFCAALAPSDLPVAAAMAKSQCSEAYFHAASENIQIHGGIGFTWEHPAHLYFKRAKSSSLLLGDPVLHRDRLATALDL